MSGRRDDIDRDGRHGGWVASSVAPPERDAYLVFVHRWRARSKASTPWLVWCPCCRVWECFVSHDEAMRAAGDIIMGGTR